ncbi:MAG: hypothetical protein JJU46_11610 [Balneolaceae bacterium]|nr:hypothetical protein [Balneolaceae bacterium]
MKKREKTTSWPSMPAFNEWEGTCTTVHMWTQIVGKIRLELAPWVNHSWGSVLYVTPVGLTTSPIPYGHFSFEIEFNFVNHRIEIRTSKGSSRIIGLEPMSVAEFYRKIMIALKELEISVTIYDKPVEVEKSIP